MFLTNSLIGVVLQGNNGHPVPITAYDYNSQVKFRADVNLESAGVCPILLRAFFSHTNPSMVSIPFSFPSFKIYLTSSCLAVLQVTKFIVAR